MLTPFCSLSIGECSDQFHGESSNLHTLLVRWSVGRHFGVEGFCRLWRAEVGAEHNFIEFYFAFYNVSTAMY